MPAPKASEDGVPNNLVANKAPLLSLGEHLAAHVLGQPHIIPEVTSALQNGELGLTDPRRPKGTFLFLGPTGVGKTELTLTFTHINAGVNPVRSPG